MLPSGLRFTDMIPYFAEMSARPVSSSFAYTDCRDSVSMMAGGTLTPGGWK